MSYDFTHGMPEDPHLKDDRDYLGADENNTDVEQGVIAVALCGLVAWLASDWLAFAIGLSLAWLAFRIVTGRIAPAELWARILEYPGKLNRIRERLHVKVVVKMLPEDVTDAEDLKGRLFHSPPENIDHHGYRETFCILAMKDRTQAEDYVLAEMLRGLKAYHEDPIRIMAAQLRRKMAPPTAPKAQPLAGVQGIGAIDLARSATGFFTPVTMWMAAIIVTLFSLNMWAWSAKADADRKAKSAREDARSWQQAALENANNAQEQARRRAEETARAIAEAEKSRELAQRERGRAERLAALRKRENEEALRGAPVDVRGSMRELAEPASADSPEPPAAGTGEGDGAR